MSNAAETSRNGPRELSRGGPLDALRFFAAFFMVIYHYAEQAPVSCSPSIRRWDAAIWPPTSS
jgi:peptidoglycan/LPS O-acetylase OafA/YrhL